MWAIIHENELQLDNEWVAQSQQKRERHCNYIKALPSEIQDHSHLKCSMHPTAR